MEQRSHRNNDRLQFLVKVHIGSYVPPAERIRANVNKNVPKWKKHITNYK